MGRAVIVFAWFSLILVTVVGWVINLIDVIQLAVAGSEFTTMFFVKVLGIFVFFIGSIIGLFF